MKERLTVEEGRQRYAATLDPVDLVEYDHQLHFPLAQIFIPAMLHVLLQIPDDVITARDLGYDLPIGAIDVEGIRIFIDPEFNRHIKKGQEYIALTALNYKGELVSLDTWYYRHDEHYTRYVDALTTLERLIRGLRT